MFYPALKSLGSMTSWRFPARQSLSARLRRLMDAGTLQRPVISSACPAVVRLIRVRFPDLCDHVLPLLSPMETAARIAKQQAMQKTGLPKEQIGCFFITPCPAKVTDIRMPIGIEKSEVDGAIAISEIFPQLSSRMDKLTPKDLESLSNSGIIGVSWATSGGESSALLKEKYLAADGIENVIRVLEEIEDERIGELDFIELNACYPGCVGGALAVGNPFIAKARLQQMMMGFAPPLPPNDCPREDMRWEKTPTASSALRLDKDVSVAMEKMEQIRRITESLPGIDCGACGSPKCRAFAEDIVAGRAEAGMCVFSDKNDKDK